METTLGDIINESVAGFENDSYDKIRADIATTDGELQSEVVAIESGAVLLARLDAHEDRLIAYQEIMNDSLESGDNGLDITAARALDVAIEGINDELEIESYGLASMESFESPASRAEATEDAIASLEGTLDKIGQGVRNLMAKLWRKIRIFVAKFLANTNKLTTGLNDADRKLSNMEKKKKYSLDDGKWLKDRGIVTRCFDGNGKSVMPETIKLAKLGAYFVAGISQESITAGAKGNYTHRAKKGSWEILGGKSITIEDKNKIIIKARPQGKSIKLSLGKLVALVKSGKKLVEAIGDLKSMTTMVDRAASSIDKSLLTKADDDGGKDESKKNKKNGTDMKSYREAASGITRAAMFFSVTMMGCLHKGGSDIIALVNQAAAGSKTDDVNKTVRGGRRYGFGKAESKLEAYDEDGYYGDDEDDFASMWDDLG